MPRHEPYDVGDVVHIDATFTDDDDVPSDPDALTLFILPPGDDADELEFTYGDSTDDPAIERADEGVYFIEYPPTLVGVYGFRWVATGAAGGGAEPGQFRVRSPYLSLWRPSADSVASELRARTRDDTGDLPGTWSNTSNPTLWQVEGMIDNACADVSREAGTIPPRYEDDARRVAQVRAAALIERGYIPEQAEATRESIYQTLRLDYEDAVKKLTKNIEMALHADAGLQ